MPISYAFDLDFGFVHTRCIGNTTLDDVRAHFKTLGADPALPAELSVLIDLTAMESIPDTPQLRAAVGEIDRLRSRVRWRGCAIVATRDALFGMSRMFEVFAQELFERSCVFRDLSQARNWLVQSGV